MKKSNKKLICIVLAMLMIASCSSVLSGCQSNSGTQTSTTSSVSSQPSETSTPKDESSEPESSIEESSEVQESSETEETDIKIEDIDWKVNQGIVDNERYVLLSYTNNSKFTVSDFEITFKEKADITEEQKTKFCSDIIKEFGFSDEDKKELQDKEISMHCTADEVVDPGKSAKNIYFCYYSGYSYVKNMDHYKLVEPDIATIKYIDGDKIYTVYYDFLSNSYSVDDTVEEAYQWTEYETFKDKVPKPDVKTIDVGINTDSAFSFEVNGVSKEQFESYIDDCIKLGYNVDSTKLDNAYFASDSEGYRVSISYHDNEKSMRCSFNKYNKKGE